MKVRKNYLVFKKTKRMKFKLSPHLSSIGSPTYFLNHNGNSIDSQLDEIMFKKPSSNHVFPLRRSSVSTASISLSWEYINVYSKRQYKCCSKKHDETISVSSTDNIVQNFEMESVSSNNSDKKNNRNQILHNGKSFICYRFQKSLKNITLVTGIIHPGQCLAIMGAR